MQLLLKSLQKLIDKDKKSFDDFHIIRFYSSFVFVSNGRVVKVTEPSMTYCPLAIYLYRDLAKSKDIDYLKNAIVEAIDKKISRFGYFTKRRELFRSNIAIPYGASEILMYAMKKDFIDASVIVCDGAGTVIVNKGEVVQGIGARMNGVFFTSPINTVIKKLERLGCRLVSYNADIDQTLGVAKAAQMGYKEIAVTINAFTNESLCKLRKMEKKYGISIIILVVCTTGITSKRVKEIERYADIVWSCASEEVRTVIGCRAILQLSKRIPVFVLTKKGLDLVSSYSSDKELIQSLNLRKQYIITGKGKGRKMKMGDFDARLSKARLPVRHEKEPVLNAVQS